jgi:hypothetical protein
VTDFGFVASTRIGAPDFVKLADPRFPKLYHKSEVTNQLVSCTFDSSPQNCSSFLVLFVQGALD